MSSYIYDEEKTKQQERLANTADMVAQRDHLVRSLRPEPGESILEIGSGNGFLTRDLLQLVGRNGSVVGLDAAESMVETARHVCAGADFVQGDAQDPPFEDGRFDAVVAAQVLCFLDDVDQALENIHRVLKPGGRVALLDTDWDTLVWRSTDSSLMERIIRAYRSAYTDSTLPRSLGERLAAAGFGSVEAESFVILNTRFDEDSYARQTVGFAASMMVSSPGFDELDRASLIGGQEELDAGGGFFFSLNRYIYTARKAG